MYNTFIIFMSQFVVVFAYGFQSQIVRLGHKLEAFIMSLFIGTWTLVAFKFVPNADIYGMIAFVLGGACGITLSIVMHKRWYLHKYGKAEHGHTDGN